MPRLPRVVLVDVPHHVTQRGNNRQPIFTTDADRAAYLDLLQQYSQLYELSLLGYCLMSNHVHLIAVPRAPAALSQALKQTHGRYATYWNARQASSGHVWQGRFYSCPLDESHLWAALRYVELNPIRARIVASATEWRWSSAPAHCGVASPHAMLELRRWQKRWGSSEWNAFLAEPESDAESGLLRRSTHTGRPLGTSQFVSALEEFMQRPLAPRRGGRPRKSVSDSRQPDLTFVA